MPKSDCTKFCDDRLPPQFVVAIDGPAGAGKTTVSRCLARQIGFDYIDTGALYRGVAHEALVRKIDPDSGSALVQLCKELSVELIRGKQGTLRLLVNDEDITERIRTPEVTMAASVASAHAPVRRYLLDLQRALARGRRAVFEGRDMGTVVFPQADIKFFLTADLNVRAKRRYMELKDKFDVTLGDIERDIARRDANDSQRSLAPLKAAEDALVIDTSGIALEAVIARFADVICKKITGA
jgi:cytidylate kinase